MWWENSWWQRRFNGVQEVALHVVDQFAVIVGVLRSGFRRRHWKVMPQLIRFLEVNLLLEAVANLQDVGRIPLSPFEDRVGVLEWIANLWHAIFAVLRIDVVIIAQMFWQWFGKRRRLRSQGLCGIQNQQIFPFDFNLNTENFWLNIKKHHAFGRSVLCNNAGKNLSLETQGLDQVALLETLGVMFDMIKFLKVISISSLGTSWSMKFAAEVKPITVVLGAIFVPGWSWTMIDQHTRSSSTSRVECSCALLGRALEARAFL